MPTAPLLEVSNRLFLEHPGNGPFRHRRTIGVDRHQARRGAEGDEPADTDRDDRSREEINTAPGANEIARSSPVGEARGPHLVSRTVVGLKPAPALTPTSPVRKPHCYIIFQLALPLGTQLVPVGAPGCRRSACRLPAR